MPDPSNQSPQPGAPAQSQTPFAVPSRNPGDDAPEGTIGTGEDTCTRCNGSGKLSGDQGCPDCNGTGVIIQGIGGG